MKIIRSKYLYLILGALLLFCSVRLYYHLTDDFRLSNIHYELPFESPWQDQPLSQEELKKISSILDQKYTYLGKGAQCYAFASEDGLYVIKFFKFKHLKPNIFIDFLPPFPPFIEYKTKCVERKKRKLISVFNGYDVAYRENKAGAQLLYLHLVPTNYLKQRVIVVDKIGIAREINLDSTVFLLQKKGETLRNRLDQLLGQKKIPETIEAIKGILNMYVREYRQGFFDHDHGVMQNTGFVGEIPFHLDVGKFRVEEQMKNKEFYKNDFEHVIWKIDSWVKRTYPGYASIISSFLEKQYEHYVGEPLDIHAIDPARFQHKKN